MANIAITSKCNLACPYCFAADVRSAPRETSRVSVKQFQEYIGFLQRSKIHEARILGGEPTLHPKFWEFVGLAREANLGVVVFTNGVWPDAALAGLEGLDRGNVRFVVNVNNPATYSEANWSKLIHVLTLLGDSATIGFNIYSTAFSLEFVPELIAELGLQSGVRLGLAHPIVGSDNVYLRPNDYAKVGERIAKFHANYPEIRLFFDCGFVPCMFPSGLFSDEDLNELGVGTGCGFIPDLMPDGSAIPCFPLGGVWKRQEALGSNSQTLRADFQPISVSTRRASLFPKCEGCDFRRDGRCLGGCLAQILSQSRKVPFSVELEPEKEPQAPRESESIWTIPYIDEPFEFWEKVAAHRERIEEVYFPVDSQVAKTGRPAQPSRRLTDFLSSSIIPAAVLINPIVFETPVREVAPAILEELARLYETYGMCHATVSSLELGAAIRDSMPFIKLTASVLMDVSEPQQAMMLREVFDVCVPSTKILRDLPRLARLKASFPGEIRLLVNESCLPGCLYRTQHFYEMAHLPQRTTSLCESTLAHAPWLSLTGGWALPQHLDRYAEITSQFKLAGRVALRDPRQYLKVLESYLWGIPRQPHEIGGGPASVKPPITITSQFFDHLLSCDKRCGQCRRCETYYATHAAQ